MLRPLLCFMSTLTFALSGTIACREQTVSGPQMIIGKDERQAARRATDQLAVGGFGGPDGLWCTAFAYEARAIATAAHCVDPEYDVTKYRFVVDGRSYAVARRLELHAAADVVLLATVDELPAHYEWSATPQAGAADRIVSYDRATFGVLSAAVGRASDAPENGIVLHTFDTVRGASGSPILSGDRVLAVHVGALPERRLNVAVRADRLATANAVGLPAFQRESCGEFVDKLIAAGIEARQNPEFRAATDTLLGGQGRGLLLDLGLQGVQWLCDQLGENSDAGEGNPDDRATVDHARDTGRETVAGRGDHPASDQMGGGFNRLLRATPNAEYYRVYYSGLLMLTLRGALGRNPTGDELRASMGHIKNGGSFGFLKVALAGFATFAKRGNNGTLSCERFCRERSPELGVGSCHRATIKSSQRGQLCDEVPGLLPGGDELSCSCVRDAFTKRGNNGTVSCSTFCNGSAWAGGTGMCLNGYSPHDKQWLGCEQSNAGRELVCQCAR